MKINSIGIIGGGTAGLITALIMRRVYPLLDIQLIESDKIGIVGVGEGSTEHWRDFMQECDIDISELIRETEATFKYGINFQNWNGDTENYLHTVSTGFNVESQTGSKVMYAYLIANGGTPKDIIHGYVEKNLHQKPFWGINQFHFDTFKLNTYLHKLCDQRNIKVIKTEIDKVNVDNDKSILSLIGSDGHKYVYDFYVDSTGFHRLLLHKSMGVNWNSYKEYLPMNSAIAFPTEKTNEIPSWTLARAMQNGWLWRIPTQSRFGNGYVFCDDFCSYDQAVQEVEDLYGYEINVGRHVKFEAGCLEKFWFKNVAAVGLSSSFVEPLEASSIGCSILQAGQLTKLIQSYIPGVDNIFAEKTYNSFNNDLLDNILEFVALHYVTKRTDTEFWKFTQTMKKPDSLLEKLEIFSYKFPSLSEFTNRNVMFKEANYIHVLHGLGLIDKGVAQRTVDIQPKYLIESLSLNARSLELESFDHMYSHREALEWLMENPPQQ